MVETSDAPQMAVLLEARSRLDLAMAMIPTIDKRQRERMLAWLDLMMRDAITPAQPVDISVSTLWDRSRLCWRVAAERGVIVPSLVEYLDSLGVGEREAPALQKLSDMSDVFFIGAWLEAGEHGLEMGWWCPDPLDLEDALAFLPNAPGAGSADGPADRPGLEGDKRALRDWAREHGIDVCTSLTHSAHPENPWTEIWLALPGDTTMDRLRASRAAYRAMSMPVPSNEAYAGLMRAADSDLAFVLGLSASGPMRIGVAAVEPKLEGAIQLAHLSGQAGQAGQQFDAQGLAAFQAALGVDVSPFAVTWLQDATGVGAELHYVLDTETTEPNP